jgi:cytochrome c2
MDTICNMPRKQILAFLSFLFFSFIFSTNINAAADGEKIFKQNCAVCHSLGTNRITGPGLAGIATRAPGGDWLHKWIKNNDKLVKSGDPYAIEISKFHPSQMNIFESVLSDEEIDAVVEYIKNPPAPPQGSGGGGGTAPDPNAVAQTEPGVSPLAVLLGVIAFLVIIIAVLRGIRFSLKNLQNEKLGLPEEEAVGPGRELLNWIYSHKRTTTVIILIILGGLLTSGWYALKDIGVYEGYHPEQPILFSHKIHAGDNAIDCQYCHSGVERSKTAGIPSVNVCMNCHKGISNGPNIGSVEGKAEIAKVYAAAGWDPEKGEYTRPAKPIEWVKVHNLQDFVFFSHQQHVKVGKQDCANCHGDVKTMNTVQQVQPLTMGWCIDCHRKTEVPGMKDNPYYESLHKKLAERFKNLPKEEQVITVAKMGGIDCVRCHY